MPFYSCKLHDDFIFLLDTEQKTGLIYLLSAAFVSPFCLIKQGVLFIDRNFCRVWESNRIIRGKKQKVENLWTEIRQNLELYYIHKLILNYP